MDGIGNGNGRLGLGERVGGGGGGAESSGIGGETFGSGSGLLPSGLGGSESSGAGVGGEEGAEAEVEMGVGNVKVEDEAREGSESEAGRREVDGMVLEEGEVRVDVGLGLGPGAVERKEEAHTERRQGQSVEEDVEMDVDADVGGERDLSATTQSESLELGVRGSEREKEKEDEDEDEDETRVVVDGGAHLDSGVVSNKLGDGADGLDNANTDVDDNRQAHIADSHHNPHSTSTSTSTLTSTLTSTSTDNLTSRTAPPPLNHTSSSSSSIDKDVPVPLSLPVMDGHARSRSPPEVVMPSVVQSGDTRREDEREDRVEGKMEEWDTGLDGRRTTRSKSKVKSKSRSRSRSVETRKSPARVGRGMGVDRGMESNEVKPFGLPSSSSLLRSPPRTQEENDNEESREVRGEQVERYPQTRSRTRRRSQGQVQVQVQEDQVMETQSQEESEDRRLGFGRVVSESQSQSQSYPHPHSHSHSHSHSNSGSHVRSRSYDGPGVSGSSSGRMGMEDRDRPSFGHGQASGATMSIISPTSGSASHSHPHPQLHSPHSHSHSHSQSRGRSQQQQQPEDILPSGLIRKRASSPRRGLRYWDPQEKSLVQVQQTRDTILPNPNLDREGHGHGRSYHRPQQQPLQPPFQHNPSRSQYQQQQPLIEDTRPRDTYTVLVAGSGKGKTSFVRLFAESLGSGSVSGSSSGSGSSKGKRSLRTFVKRVWGDSDDEDREDRDHDDDDGGLGFGSPVGKPRRTKEAVEVVVDADVDVDSGFGEAALAGPSSLERRRVRLQILDTPTLGFASSSSSSSSSSPSTRVDPGASSLNASSGIQFQPGQPEFTGHEEPPPHSTSSQHDPRHQSRSTQSHHKAQDQDPSASSSSSSVADSDKILNGIVSGIEGRFWDTIRAAEVWEAQSRDMGRQMSEDVVRELSGERHVHLCLFLIGPSDIIFPSHSSRTKSRGRSSRRHTSARDGDREGYSQGHGSTSASASTSTSPYEARRRAGERGRYGDSEMLKHRSRSRGDMDVEAQAQSATRGSITTTASTSASAATPVTQPNPSLPTVREPTLHAIRMLSRVTNVLPVLSFADSWTDGQVGDVKRGVRGALAMWGVGFGVFDADAEAASASASSGVGVGSNGDERSRDTGLLSVNVNVNVNGGVGLSGEKGGARTLGMRRTIPRLPYAIVNPDWEWEPYGDFQGQDRREEVENRRGIKDEMISPVGPFSSDNVALMDVDVPPARKFNRKPRFVRKYRWGEIDVLDEQHCDFVPLVKAVLKHIQLLKDYTREFLFEEFRREAAVHQQEMQRQAYPQPQYPSVPETRHHDPVPQDHGRRTIHDAVQIVEYGSAPRSSVSSPTPSRVHQLAPEHSERGRSPRRHAPLQSVLLSHPHAISGPVPGPPLNVHGQPSAIPPASSSSVAMPIAGSSAREPAVPLQEMHATRPAPYAFGTPQEPAPYPSLKTLERSLEGYPHRPPHRTARLGGGHHRELEPSSDNAAPKFERGVVPPLDPERWERERERERDSRMVMQQWENEQRAREMESRMVEPGARHPREPQSNLKHGPAYPSFPLPPPPSAVSQRPVSSSSSPSGSHVSHGHNHGPPLPHSHSYPQSSHPQSSHPEPYTPSREPPAVRHVGLPHPEQLSLPLPQIQTRESHSHASSQRQSLPPISTVASDLSVGRDSDRSFPGSAKEGSDFGGPARQRHPRHVQEHPHGNGQGHPHGHPEFPVEEERSSRRHTRIPSERAPVSEGNWQHGRDQRLQPPHHEYGSGGVSPDSPRSVISGRHSHPNSLPHSRSQSHSSRPPPLQTHTQPGHHAQYGSRPHEDVNIHERPIQTPHSAPASSIPSVITSSHPSSSAWPDSDRGGSIVNTPSGHPASNRSLPPLSLSPTPHGSHGHGPSPYSRPLSASSTHLDRPHHGYPSHESISPYGYGQSLGPNSAGLSPGYGHVQQRTPVSPGDIPMPSSGTSSSISGSFPLSAGSMSVNGISPVSSGGAGKKDLRKNPKNKKIQVACNFCRLRKLKCDGGRPRCSQCVKRSNPCDYSTQSKRRGPVYASAVTLSTPTSANEPPSSVTQHEEGSEDEGEESSDDQHGSVDMRLFNDSQRRPDGNFGTHTPISASSAGASSRVDHAFKGSPIDHRVGNGTDVNIRVENVPEPMRGRHDMEMEQHRSRAPRSSKERPHEGYNPSTPYERMGRLSHEHHPYQQQPRQADVSPQSSYPVDPAKSGPSLSPSGVYSHGRPPVLVNSENSPTSSVHTSAGGPIVTPTSPGGASPVPIRPASDAQAAQRKKAASSAVKARPNSNYGPKVVACNFCRARKTKCDGQHPQCASCQRRNLACSYVNDGTGNRKRGPGPTLPSGASVSVMRAGAYGGPMDPSQSNSNTPDVSRAQSPLSATSGAMHNPGAHGPGHGHMHSHHPQLENRPLSPASPPLSPRQMGHHRHASHSSQASHGYPQAPISGNKRPYIPDTEVTGLHAGMFAKRYRADGEVAREGPASARTEKVRG